MRPKRRTVLFSLRGIALALALGVAVPTALAATSKTVAGKAFRTKAPAGWSVRTINTGRGSHTYAMSSHGNLDAVSVPAKGRIGISVYELPLKLLKLEHPATATPTDLLAAGVIGTPRGATRLTQSAFSSRRLRGRIATDVTFLYTYHGRRIRQQDTVVRYGTYAVTIETDADASRRGAAARASGSVRAHWRWR